MPTISQSRIIKLPKAGSRPLALLQALLAGPGTFYQVCERAKIDIEALSAESYIRGLFASQIHAGTVSLDVITYRLTLRARVALEGRAEQDVGQVAAPHFRGAPAAMPVLVVRRSPDARA